MLNTLIVEGTNDLAYHVILGTKPSTALNDIIVKVNLQWCVSS